MTSSQSPKKKYFTVAEANATLPLLRAILRDVVELACHLKDRQERLSRLRMDPTQSHGSAYAEEIEQIEADFHRDQDRMAEFEEELFHLGVELKDYFSGLIDFPHLRDDREVYLCWKLGEPEVTHWHELNAGFSGRQKLVEDLAKT